MVAGGYSHSKPVVLKYAPSHGERPQARGSREKGKGWQRSKSSMYDYGSDLYFSEEKTTRYRRAQSSMSGRRTDKNSSFYEIDCPAKQPRRRRASVEAVVESKKPAYASSQAAAPVGPPIQKRVLTVKQTAPRECISPNKPITGFSRTSKDKNLQQVQINDREGPKARTYTPKFDVPGAEPIPFPALDHDNEIDHRSYECKQRFMDMLVTTESFKERQGEVSDETLNYQTNDTDPWPVFSAYQPDEKSPFSKFLNEMRIELKDSKVPQNRIVDGRVYFDLREPATVDSIGLDVNKTLAMTTPDGKVIIPSRDDKNYAPELKLLPNRQPKLNVPGAAPPMDSNPGSNPTPNPSYGEPSSRPPSRPLPNDFALVQTIPKRIALPAGRSAIPFQIYVPDNQPPSFSYTSLKGPSVFNNYSVDGAVRMSGNTERTGRVAIVVPALGTQNVAYRDEDKNYDLIMHNKYFTNDDGFNWAVGYHSSSDGYSKPDRARAQIVRVAKCSAIGLNDVVPLGKPHDVNFRRGHSNDVLEKYLRNNPPLKNEWDENAYEENVKVSSNIPTVSTSGFTCDYFLELDVDGEKYRAPVIKVDEYTTEKLRRSDIGQNSRRNDFKVNI